MARRRGESVAAAQDDDVGNGDFSDDEGSVGQQEENLELNNGELEDLEGQEDQEDGGNQDDADLQRVLNVDDGLEDEKKFYVVATGDLERVDNLEDVSGSYHRQTFPLPRQIVNTLLPEEQRIGPNEWEDKAKESISRGEPSFRVTDDANCRLRGEGPFRWRIQLQKCEKRDRAEEGRGSLSRSQLVLRLRAMWDMIRSADDDCLQQMAEEYPALAQEVTNRRGEDDGFLNIPANVFLRQVQKSADTQKAEDLFGVPLDFDKWPHGGQAVSQAVVGANKADQLVGGYNNSLDLVKALLKREGIVMGMAWDDDFKDKLLDGFSVPSNLSEREQRERMVLRSLCNPKKLLAPGRPRTGRGLVATADTIRRQAEGNGLITDDGAKTVLSFTKDDGKYYQEDEGYASHMKRTYIFYDERNEQTVGFLVVDYPTENVRYITKYGDISAKNVPLIDFLCSVKRGIGVLMVLAAMADVVNTKVVETQEDIPIDGWALQTATLKDQTLYEGVPPPDLLLFYHGKLGFQRATKVPERNDQRWMGVSPEKMDLLESVVDLGADPKFPLTFDPTKIEPPMTAEEPGNWLFRPRTNTDEAIMDLVKSLMMRGIVKVTLRGAGGRKPLTREELEARLAAPLSGGGGQDAPAEPANRSVVSGVSAGSGLTGMEDASRDNNSQAPSVFFGEEQGKARNYSVIDDEDEGAERKNAPENRNSSASDTMTALGGGEDKSAIAGML